MRIDIISVQPELLTSPFEHSIMKRAQQRGILEVVVHNLKDFGLGNNKQVDDYQYGGGAGMVMMIEPIENCIKSLQAERRYDAIIFMTPDGKRYNQRDANQLSLKENIIIICGHYKGIDERIRAHYVTMEISVGDFVLSGGDLAAAIVVDSVGRLIPGVLNDETSALTDSFQDDLLAPPVYTRPAEYNGWKVPDVLLSGNQALIDQWRFDQAVKRTKERRPDLWDKYEGQ